MGDPVELAAVGPAGGGRRTVRDGAGVQHMAGRPGRGPRPGRPTDGRGRRPTCAYGSLFHGELGCMI